MAIGRPRRETCKLCGKTPDDGYLSNNGNCRKCIKRRMNANSLQLKHHAGPYYERWQKAMRDVVDRYAP